MKRKKKNVTSVQKTPERIPMKQRYQADADFGLTAEQVKEYRAHGWDNRSVAPPSKSVSDIVKSNVLTYFNLIFLLLSVILFLVGAYRDMSFLPIIIANSLIGIVQELSAKKTLDNLTVLNAPKATVVRNGKTKTIAAERLVLDDIVIFSAGAQIPADAKVIKGSVKVNESLLTGESDEIVKNPGDSLMSGSFIVSGSCHARLEKIGEDSYVNKLTMEAKAARVGEQSEMIRSIDKIVLIAGISIVPIGLILFYQGYWIQQNSMKESVTSMVAAVIGMIPEGLYLLSSVTLAVSAARLAMKKVLVHDMKCIETLARVDVLCVDKTGTITENKMLVQDVITLEPYENDKSIPPIEELLSNFAEAQEADNITMEAMKERFTTPGADPVVDVTGFSSAYKYSSATFNSGSYVLGAPEFILRGDYDTYREQIEAQGKLGYRVLVFGKYPAKPDGGKLVGTVTPYALVIVANKIRNDAKKTFQYFHRQGVEVKVISGDNPVTVSEVAKQAGIANADLYVDASTLKTEEDIDEAMKKYVVFGRVTPNQKRAFVQALKKQKHTVAMTGDGVNDVLALKDADCSVAMAAGSDAAAQAAQIVLLDNDFAHMPQIVGEGRQVVNNLERSGSLFLVKNIFSLLLSLFSIFVAMSYPLRPSQISLISAFTIGLPGFLNSQIPNRDRITGNFLHNIIRRAIPAALTDFIVIASLVIFGEVFAVSSKDISTASAILMAIVGFMILYHIMKPMNKIKWGIWGICLAGMLFCLAFMHSFFGITGMSMRCIMLFVVFSITTEPILRYLIKLQHLAGRGMHRLADALKGTRKALLDSYDEV
jgi:cation-transporting ATPase E|uniref:P-type ATPase, translocating n=1 Tax=Eubacterium cellulosolvens (strain ATCC 43171 / JCM 9499 / 6) TaxID=633697 RepID=I5AQP9_EUBC6